MCSPGKEANSNITHLFPFAQEIKKKHFRASFGCPIPTKKRPRRKWYTIDPSRIGPIRWTRIKMWHSVLPSFLSGRYDRKDRFTLREWYHICFSLCLQTVLRPTLRLLGPLSRSWVRIPWTLVFVKVFVRVSQGLVRKAWPCQGLLKALYVGLENFASFTWPEIRYQS